MEKLFLTSILSKANCYFAPGRGSKYCDERVFLSVCLYVCLSVCLPSRISHKPVTTYPNFTKCFSHFNFVRSSVLFWRMTSQVSKTYFTIKTFKNCFLYVL